MCNRVIAVTRCDRSASRGAVVTRSAGRQIVVNDEVSDGYWQGMAGDRVIGLLIGVLGGLLGVLIAGATRLLVGSLFDLDDADETRVAAQGHCEIRPSRAQRSTGELRDDKQTAPCAISRGAMSDTSEPISDAGWKLLDQEAGTGAHGTKGSTSPAPSLEVLGDGSRGPEPAGLSRPR